MPLTYPTIIKLSVGAIKLSVDQDERGNKKQEVLEVKLSVLPINLSLLKTSCFCNPLYDCLCLSMVFLGG